ncbi:MAG: VWA domain-containing protein [Alphaproteobacteria bacterium]|nr:VWA domain-containing protein [Alphaproteobacteria bacterium]
MERKDENLPSEVSQRRAIDDFLRHVAAAPAVRAEGRGRLMFALDATASRQPMWDRACRIQGEMFKATDALGGLDVQLVFYRGFGECRKSKWLGSADQLVRAMTAVACLGGQTQIGRVLGHAIAETRHQRVNALVFIGDALEEGIDPLCDAAGQLGVLGVPVFMFHEGGHPLVAEGFRQIARLSGGAYAPFDLGSAEQLKALLGAVAAYAAGGRRALAGYGQRSGGAALLLAHQVK